MAAMGLSRWSLIAAMAAPTKHKNTYGHGALGRRVRL